MYEAGEICSYLQTVRARSIYVIESSQGKEFVSKLNSSRFCELMNEELQQCSKLDIMAFWKWILDLYQVRRKSITTPRISGGMSTEANMQRLLWISTTYMLCHSKKESRLTMTESLNNSPTLGLELAVSSDVSHDGFEKP